MEDTLVQEVNDTELELELENQIKKEDWFKALVEECNGAVVEAGFTSRWAIIEGYHILGELIQNKRDEFELAGIKSHNIPKMLAGEITNLKQSSIEKAVQFYNKYPDLSLLPDGKNVSWFQICQKYLPTPRVKKEKEAEIGIVEGEVEELIESIANPQVTFIFDEALGLWKVIIDPSDLAKIDVVGLMTQLDTYLKSQ